MTDEHGTQDFTRRFADRVLMWMATALGAMSTLMLSILTTWTFSISSRVNTLEARNAASEEHTKAVDAAVIEIKQDLKEIKAAVKK